VSGPRYRIEALGVLAILPVLFRHARNLTRIMGGNAELPEFSAWLKLPKPTRTAAVAAAVPVKKYRAATAPRAGR
jgi:hypothetical protein